MITTQEMIESIIIAKDCTQKQLAKELNVSESRICDWLKGTKPHFKTLCKIKQMYSKMKEAQK